MQVEDRMLVWRLNRGDARALSRVYEKYRDDLLRLAASMLGDGATAGSLKGYLATCVANAARNRLKAAQRKATTSLEEAAGVRSETPSPEQWMIGSEQFERVSRAISSLPSEQREVVTLHLYGDMRFREIAEWQKTSVKTVQSRYRYGLEKLRSVLNGEVAE